MVVIVKLSLETQVLPRVVVANAQMLSKLEAHNMPEAFDVSLLGVDFVKKLLRQVADWSGVICHRVQ